MKIRDLLILESFKIKEKRKNPDSIKLYHHQDMDGVMSAMLAYRQLVKQKIDPSRIELYPIQYGKQKPEFFNVKKGQKSIVVDFGGIPEEEDGQKIRKPDINSDHHVVDDKIKAAFAEAKKVAKELKGKKDRTEEETKKFKEAVKVLRDTSRGGVRKGEARDESRLLPLTDIHKSDTERIGVLHASKLADYSFMKQVSRVDSADINDLDQFMRANVSKENLPHLVNLLILNMIKIDADVGRSGSKTTGVTEYIIRHGKPNINYLYTMFSKASSPVRKILENQKSVLAQIKKPASEKDSNKILKLMKGLSKQTNRKIMKGDLDDKEIEIPSKGKEAQKRIKEYNNLRKAGSRGAEHGADYGGAASKTMLTKKKFVLVSTNGKDFKINKEGTEIKRLPSPDRYVYNAVEYKKEEDGTKYGFPVIVRNFGNNSIQVAMSPLLDKNIKEKIDLLEISKKALKKLMYADFSDGWGIHGIKVKGYGHAGKVKEMMADIGGHKSIANIPNFWKLGSGTGGNWESKKFGPKDPKTGKRTQQDVYNTDTRIQKAGARKGDKEYNIKAYADGYKPNDVKRKPNDYIGSENKYEYPDSLGRSNSSKEEKARLDNRKDRMSSKMMDLNWKRANRAKIAERYVSYLADEINKELKKVIGEKPINTIMKPFRFETPKFEKKVSHEFGVADRSIKIPHSAPREHDEKRTKSIKADIEKAFKIENAKRSKLNVKELTMEEFKKKYKKGNYKLK